MHVGVDQARDDPLAGGAQRVGVGGNGTTGASTRAGNAPVARHDYGIAHRGGAAAVQERRPDDRQGRRRRVRRGKRGRDGDLPPRGRVNEDALAHATYAAGRVHGAVAVDAVGDVRRDRNDAQLRGHEGIRPRGTDPRGKGVIALAQTVGADARECGGLEVVREIGGAGAGMNGRDVAAKGVERRGLGRERTHGEQQAEGGSGDAHFPFTLAYTRRWNRASSDHAGGRCCVHTIATRSARGSTQKKVDAAPAQRNVPGDPGTVVSESTRTAPPYPNPFLPGGQSAVIAGIGVSTGGRWFCIIRVTVSRLSTRCPSSSPPFRSIWAKRR